GVLVVLACLTSRRSTAVSNSRRARVKNLTPEIRSHWYEVAFQAGLACHGDGSFLRVGGACRGPVAERLPGCTRPARARPGEGEQAAPPLTSSRSLRARRTDRYASTSTCGIYVVSNLPSTRA